MNLRRVHMTVEPLNLHGTAKSVRTAATWTLAGIALLAQAGIADARDPAPSGVKALTVPIARSVETGSQTVPPVAEEYRLDKGDRVRTRFLDRYDKADLNGDYTIDAMGRLRLPRLGAFNARHVTTSELEQAIRDAAESRGEKLGSFSIELVECRPFYVSGLASKPGPYPYVAGITVMHAVAVAGGIYRSPAVSVAETIRERSRLSDSIGQLKIQLARRARLVAERDNASVIPVPSQLARLDPAQAEAFIAREQTVLSRAREVVERESASLSRFITLTRDEIESYETQLTAMNARILEQNKLFKSIQQLHDQRLVNQQRFVEVLSAMDLVQRDKQRAEAGLARAKATLEKADRDHAMLSLENGARISKELAAVEAEIARLTTAVEDSRGAVDGLEALSGQMDSVAYRIMRRDQSGRARFISATESTPIKPDDVITIERVGEMRISPATATR
jgi:polysaccharide biosynthesis/export protein ExoF